MAGRLNTLAGRLILVLLVIHAISMPVLYFTLAGVFERSTTDTFIDSVRSYGRTIADSFEAYPGLGSDEGIIAHLDSVMFGGGGVYAVLEVGGKTFRSSLMGEEEVGLFREDFTFGEHGDDIYYLSVALSDADPPAVLRFGFDEVPIHEGIEQVRKTIVMTLVGYLLLALLGTTVLSARVVRPIKELQGASRRIASGEYERKLTVDSTLDEIRGLSRDLEKMRSNLVGINARLQQEIADRVAAESERRSLEERVRHSQRLESLGTLAGGVAHEFNNVLQPLVLYTDLALEDLPEDSPVVPNLARILDLARRAKNLSRQILTFSRQGSPAALQNYRLDAVIEEGLTMIRALLPATVDLRWEISPSGGLVACDPAEIHQLLINLCNNAFRSLNGGSGQIRVSLDTVEVSQELAARHPDLRVGEYERITVADTGEGMDPATLARIFEPFFTTRKVGEGTGLGLSVVHGIVRRFRGDIIVRSERGRGTVFEIYLPIVSELEETE